MARRDRGARAGAARRHRASSSRPSARVLLAATVGRFSTLAGAAIALVLASGVIQAVIGMSAFDELLDTAYGRAVLVKLALLLAIVGFGWLNRARLLPRLRSATTPGAAGVLLRRTLRVELALAARRARHDGRACRLPALQHDRRGPLRDRRPHRPRAARGHRPAGARRRQRDAPLPLRPRRRPPVRRDEGAHRRRVAARQADRPDRARRRARRAPATTSSRAPRSRSRATGGSRSPRASASSTSTAPASRSPSDEHDQEAAHGALQAHPRLLLGAPDRAGGCRGPRHGAARDRAGRRLHAARRARPQRARRRRDDQGRPQAPAGLPLGLLRAGARLDASRSPRRSSPSRSRSRASTSPSRSRASPGPATASRA